MKIIRIVKEVGRNSRVDWITILILTALTALALGAGGVYLYNAVMRGEIVGNTVAPTTSVNILDGKALTTVTEDFDRKDEVSRETRAGYAGLGDPSI